MLYGIKVFFANNFILFSDWLTVTWAQSGMHLQPDAPGEDSDSVRGRYGRAGSLAVTPGEKLMELLRPNGGTPRRHSTAACAPPQPKPSGFVYCPSDALPYCPPSRFAPSHPVNKLPPPQVQQPPQPPPVPQRTAPVVTPLPVPPPAPPRRSSPQPPRRVPPPTPPRPNATTTDPNGNKRPPPAPQKEPPPPKLDCNRNPQPPAIRRSPQKMPDTPYTPAPLPQNNQMKQSPSSSSNISVRQDSNVSSDSFSQTSSPSYTTKTMEAPLLPHQHVNKSLNAKIARGLLLKEQQEKEAGNSSITKSMSTPASLQTIVRFQNGSNMSLHHRMLRDMRGTNTDTSAHKFRLMQLALNAVMLLAITGALFAYFKANPAVQYVSQAVNLSAAVTWPTPTEPPGARNPAPGVCLPVIVTFCHQHRISYNFTVFPNYIGHFGQRDAQQDLEIYDAVVDVRCYELTALFLCSLFVPKCGPLGHMVRPCRSLCQETMRRCGFFLEVFGLSMPDYLQCEIFPESTDRDVCLGNREVKEARFRAAKPVCPTGFQCDMNRCIPHDWRCDGHVDCADRSDELNCRVCKRSGDVHCGNQRCISQAHLCDGKIDCPWGQDERNCLRLSKANGDVGRGELQVYRAANQSWFPACITTLDDPTASKLCSMLGYSWVNKSTVVGGAGARAGGGVQAHGVAQSYRAFQRSEGGLLRELKDCRHDSARVHLVCDHYECGRRRTIGGGTKRIVGGVEASPGDWPFLAAILGGPEEVFYCAGVLVADQWVLTASHCVGNHSDVNGWTIQLGITRRRSHAYYGQKVKVRRVVPHPLYNVGVAHDNDIALFQLAVRVRYHEQLSPVCLPPPRPALAPGTLCTVIGWGKRDDKDMSEYEPAVNEVEVPVLQRELCNQWLEHRDLNVTEGMICAGYPEGGKDACQGDSGGPLLCRDPSEPSRWVVGGIVSWGIKCAHPRLPGVYAYVPRYVPWILAQIRLYNDDSAVSEDI
ncbi:unnamed protein product [Danaus chrysippus]|uniref:(African queen) hypothetical protein n=1 Tax=Danaus chrysippus TaxID=151541 RepID=A0A8J2R559_9NEOP|nr:unnamed protein product [Danaus chrysippus]